VSPDGPPVLRYVEQQLAALKKYPLMWGPPLCVELSYLQLLETLVVALRPDLDQREPMLVKERYRRFLAARFPSLPPGYLAHELGERRISELVSALSEFEGAIRAEASPQNPFEHCDLALELVLQQGAAFPSSTTLTSYLETLRRVIRGTVGGPRRKGRVRKEMEALTDFDVPSVQVSPANGAPGRVLFPMHQRKPAQRDPDGGALREVRDAVGHLVTVMDWAAGDAELSELRALVDEPQRRQFVATQVMRLLPHGEVREVRLGGSLVSRYRPASLVASAKRNLMTILLEDQPAEPFDGQGILRALDLDQATFRLRTDDGAEHHCLYFLDPVEALQWWEFEARVRVIGQRVSSLTRKAVVLVDKLEIIFAP
jgi:hypothetical protein